jgi:uncharacterized membrane protein YphA (DoxX/SURF4 family)
MSSSSNLCGAPFLLRLALGVVFVWAGMIKVCGSMPVKGEPAANLANMGVIKPAAPAAAPTPAPAGNGSAAPAAPATPPAEVPPPKKQGGLEPTDPTIVASTTPVLLTVASPKQPAYTAEDFPDDVQVKPLYFIALMLKQAASGIDAAGQPTKAIWPSMLAQDHWPVWLAWACALTELIGGGMVLLGLLTRFWAFSLACVMGVAMWLTEIGPAIASGNTKLGILPNHDWLNGQAWASFQIQFVMLMVALAVMGLGAGRMSLDRVLFPPPVPPARPKPENPPAA